MEWSHDFCLYCDKQTAGDLYCSQACRLADLESSGSTPVSPAFNFSSEPNWSTTTPTQPKASSNNTHKRSSTQFTLPPPFNFQAYRTTAPTTADSPPQSPRSAAPSSSKVQTVAQSAPARDFVYTPNPRPLHRTVIEYTHLQTTPRTLNTYSSRSSLSSVSSSGSTTQGLSDQALSQLQIYSNAFDPLRDWKRRVTLG